MNSMVTVNVQFFNLLYDYFELVFDTVIVEDNIIHSGIPNYTKLAFSSLKTIQNDKVY